MNFTPSHVFSPTTNCKLLITNSLHPQVQNSISLPLKFAVLTTQFAHGGFEDDKHFKPLPVSTNLHVGLGGGVTVPPPPLPLRAGLHLHCMVTPCSVCFVTTIQTLSGEASHCGKITTPPSGSGINSSLSPLFGSALIFLPFRLGLSLFHWALSRCIIVMFRLLGLISLKFTILGVFVFAILIYVLSLEVLKVLYCPRVKYSPPNRGSWRGSELKPHLILSPTQFAPG